MPKEYLSEKSPIIDSQKSKKNKKKTLKNDSHKSLQSWPDVLQHPVVATLIGESTY